jgi:diguanylate cyclase (GGDEF)-like protein
VLIGLSTILVRREFSLGGVVSGLLLMQICGWSAVDLQSSGGAISAHLLAELTPLYVGGCLLHHWFVRMEHRIEYDPLLHIYNREFCTRILDEQSRIKTTPPLCIAMVDIDHFKKVNDTHGHRAGDTVLHAVAQLVSREVVPHGTVCRYGGEEFAVFFPNRQLDTVMPILEQVRQKVEQHKIPTEKKTLGVTISIGTAQRTSLSQSLPQVL